MSSLPVLALAGAVAAAAPARASTPACEWEPPPARATVAVATTAELARAVKDAAPGTRIEIEDGRYLLPHSLDLAAPDVALVGKSRSASRVLLHGTGMEERKVGVALSVSAPRVTIAHVSVGKVGHHAIQIRGERGASNVTVFGARLFDTGQQLLKGSVSTNGRHADEGIVACSTLEYTHHAPSDYTNAIDVLAGKGWVVRDNRIRNIRGPKAGGWKAGPAILFWANSLDTRVERNVVTDCYRGIAFGLGPGVSRLARDGERVFDHQGGAIVGNLVVNRNEWADEGIEASAARDVEIVGNRVFVDGRLPWSISLRFPSTTALVERNVTSRRIAARSGATVRRTANALGREDVAEVSAGAAAASGEPTR